MGKNVAGLPPPNLQPMKGLSKLKAETSSLISRRKDPQLFLHVLSSQSPFSLVKIYGLVLKTTVETDSLGKKNKQIYGPSKGSVEKGMCWLSLCPSWEVIIIVDNFGVGTMLITDYFLESSQQPIDVGTIRLR